MAKPSIGSAVQLNYHKAVNGKKSSSQSTEKTHPPEWAMKEAAKKKEKRFAKPYPTQADANPLPASDIPNSTALGQDELANLIRLKSQIAAKQQPVLGSDKVITATSNQSNKKQVKQTKQTKHTTPGATVKTGSKQLEDIAWWPAVPPGHTRYSWEAGRTVSRTTTHQTKKAMTFSINEVMKKFRLDTQEIKETQLKTVKLHSRHLTIENGVLRWGTKEEKKLPRKEMEEIFKDVEDAIMNQANNNTPRITQGVHDRYVKFCVGNKRKILFIEDFQWHTSKYLEIKSGSLTLYKPIWTEEKIESIASLAENDIEEFIKEVEYCIYERFPISEGVDSAYLQYCATSNHTPMAHYVGQEAYEHGYRLLHGIMVPMDKQTGMHYIRQAASLDQYPPAQSLLGYCYQFGDVARVDVDQAVEYYQMAVANGDDFGKIRLGRCYSGGIGVAKDVKKAERLFEDGFSGLRLIADSKRIDSNRALCLLHTQPAKH